MTKAPRPTIKPPIISTTASNAPAAATAPAAKGPIADKAAVTAAIAISMIDNDIAVSIDGWTFNAVRAPKITAIIATAPDTASKAGIAAVARGPVLLIISIDADMASNNVLIALAFSSEFWTFISDINISNPPNNPTATVNATIVFIDPSALFPTWVRTVNIPMRTVIHAVATATLVGSSKLNTAIEAARAAIGIAIFISIVPALSAFAPEKDDSVIRTANRAVHPAKNTIPLAISPRDNPRISRTTMTNAPMATDIFNSIDPALSAFCPANLDNNTIAANNASKAAITPMPLITSPTEIPAINLTVRANIATAPAILSINAPALLAFSPARRLTATTAPNRTPHSRRTLIPF